VGATLLAWGILAAFSVRAIAVTGDLIEPQSIDNLETVEHRLVCIVDRIEEMVPPGSRLFLDGNHLVVQYLNSKLFERYELVAEADNPEVVLRVGFAPFDACSATSLEVITP
jgi:hypothetical protein